jgi:hypothetical protein
MLFSALLLSKRNAGLSASPVLFSALRQDRLIGSIDDEEVHDGMLSLRQGPFRGRGLQGRRSRVPQMRGQIVSLTGADVPSIAIA